MSGQQERARAGSRQEERARRIRTARTSTDGVRTNASGIRTARTGACGVETVRTIAIARGVRGGSRLKEQAERDEIIKNERGRGKNKRAWAGSEQQERARVDAMDADE